MYDGCTDTVFGRSRLPQAVTKVARNTIESFAIKIVIPAERTETY